MTEAEQARHDLMVFNACRDLTDADMAWVKARAKQSDEMTGEERRQFLNASTDAYRSEHGREAPRGLAIFLIAATSFPPNPSTTDP